MTRGFVKKRHVGEFLGSWEVRLYQGHVALVLPAVHTPHAYTPLYTMESLSTDTRHLPAFRPTTNNISMNISMHTRETERSIKQHVRVQEYTNMKTSTILVRAESR